MITEARRQRRESKVESRPAAWSDFWKWLSFGLIFSAVLTAIFGGRHPFAIAVASGVLAWIALILFETWRGRREQREMAFEAWLDRAAALGRQYDIHINGDGRPYWREFFDRGLTPEAAVKMVHGTGEQLR